MSNTAKKVQQYWEDRAKSAQLNVTATTDDVYLRSLEVKTFINEIKKIKKKNLRILDIGCGDGFTTISVAREVKGSKFIGVDYSENMIANAKNRLKSEASSVAKRLDFFVGDATKLMEQFKPGEFDVIISSRCLINLTTPNQQYKTIGDISKILKRGGVYLGIENFLDGNNELNKVRKELGLNEISVRWHNLFFKPNEYLTKTKKMFKNVEIINFTSAYYFATRVIYSKYCQMTNVQPDYLHEIHQLAIDLPTTGNFSPIKLIRHKK